MNFEKILVALTCITGIVWFINKFLNNKRDPNPIIIKEQQNNFINITEYVASFFIIFLIVLLFRTFLFEGYRIPSGSMKPTLIDGDFILVNKYIYGLRLPINHKKIFTVSEIKRGDIIIFWQEKSNKILIKRAVGLPGDHIVYKDQNLYINNNLIKTSDMGFTHDGNMRVNRKKEFLNSVEHEIYVNPHDFRIYPFDDIVVGKDSYFVMGDNRGNSADSRFEGLVADQDVLGKAFFIYFNFDLNNWVFHFERMFTKIK